MTPKQIEDTLALANKLFDQGDYRQSKQQYCTILRSQPGNTTALYRMALICESFGEYDAVLEFYRAAIKIIPGDITLISRCIRTLIKMGRVKEARALLSGCKDVFQKAEAFSCYESLRMQLDPKRKLDFFYDYLGHLGIFDYEYGELMQAGERSIPLLTNTFLHWFETQDWKEKKFLELGSGSSTLYFSRHFKYIHSLETNEEWFSKLSALLPENVAYTKINSIHDHLAGVDVNTYNAVLIDCSESRAAVTKELVKQAYDGIIFFDNSERYRKSIKLLNSHGFLEIPFFGLKPVENGLACTSVLVKQSKLREITNTDWAKLPKYAEYAPHNSWDIID